MAGQKVQIVSRDGTGIVVRDTEGNEYRIHGGNVSMVFCSPRDLDDAIAGNPDPDVSVECTMTPNGFVLCFGTANRL